MGHEAQSRLGIARRVVHIHLVTQRYLTVPEVATLLRVPERTLYSWKYSHRGPPAVKIGRYLRYDFDKLIDWIESGADGPDRAH
jgi:excisionase family DNA binding protein